MLELTVDTNIVVAAMLKAGTTCNLLFDKNLKLFSPSHVLFEIENHADEFIAKSGLTREQLFKTVESISSRIGIISFEDYSQKATESITISPDPDDWPFFAAALCKNRPLWSNDAKLKAQNKVTVYSTSEVLELLAQKG